MRFCLVSAHFPPDLSGIGDYTYFLACALADMGHEVHVITSAGSSDSGLYPAREGVLVHRIVSTWSVRNLHTLVKGIRQIDPGVLLLQYIPHAFDQRGMTFAINLLPTLIALRTRTRVVVNFHEVHIDFDRSLRRCAGSMWQRAMAFLLATSAHGVTVVSTEWSRRLRQTGVWKHIEVIPVGSSIPRQGVRPEEIGAIRQALRASDGTILIGCFGSAGPHQDVRLAEAALRRVQEYQRAKLVWLGKADFESSSVRTGTPVMVREASDFIWTGQLPHPEISRILSACDLVILPFTEGVSTKHTTLAAALLHGLPVVTTRASVLDEIFVHRHNIYAVPLGEVRGFCEGVAEVCRDDELRGELARGARQLHQAYFGWDRIARLSVRSALATLGTTH